MANMEADRFFGEVAPPDLPLARFYTWDRPTISLGCNQNPARRIDLESCRRDSIPLIQRPTGGRELLHGHDLCYSVAIPQSSPVDAVKGKRIFAEITDALVKALIDMGIAAEGKKPGNHPRAVQGPCFAQVDAGEITIGGKKLVASAQRIFSHCIIQQGSIPLFRPDFDLASYLRLENKEQIRWVLNSNTAYLFEQLRGTYSLGSIVEAFGQAFTVSFSGPAGPAKELLDNFKGNNSKALWYY
jgi:lipoate-protein ligase A